MTMSAFNFNNTTPATTNMFSTTTQSNPFSAFGNQQTQPSQSPFFSTTPQQPQQSQLPIFSTTSQQPQQAGQPNADKSQVLNTLVESKSVQIAILNELKTLNARFPSTFTAPAPATLPSTPPALPAFQPGAFSVSPFKQVHIDVFCNVCNKKGIQGVRYKCLFCKDFDLCEDCESKSGVHDITHHMIKIRDTNTFNHKMSINTPLFNAVP